MVAAKQFYTFQANPDSAKEMSRRTMWLLAYLLRAPLFDKTIKPTIQTLEQVSWLVLVAANGTVVVMLSLSSCSHILLLHVA